MDLDRTIRRKRRMSPSEGNVSDGNQTNVHWAEREEGEKEKNGEMEGAKRNKARKTQ